MWAIHNSIKGWTLFDISERELKLIVNTLSPNEIKLSQVCAKGKDWVQLSSQSFPELFSNMGKENHQDYPEIKGQEQTTTDTDFFIIKPQKVYHTRLHNRYHVDLRVVIEGQSRSFESRTIDMSEGGIYFKDVIPDWVSGYFIVRVYSETVSFQVICSLVEDQKIKQRVQIVSEENDAHYLRYKDWLKTLPTED